MTYNKTWLIQRVLKPHRAERGPLEAPVDTMAFGGGKLRGGLSKEAFELLGKILRWDYMGCAEFEFGALPDALNRIAAATDLRRWELPVEVVVTWLEEPRDSARKRGKPPAPRLAPLTLYVIGREGHREQINTTLIEIAADKYRLKEGVRHRMAGYVTGLYSDFLGGVELDNGWWFFVDKEPRDHMATLFGVREERESD